MKEFFSTFAPPDRKRPGSGIAKIAQLVEHDLAKVGVAGSSPVFRSKSFRMKLVKRVYSLIGFPFFYLLKVLLPM